MPKKTGSGRAKRASGLAQPTLSFQSRIPSQHPSKRTLKSRTSSDLSRPGVEGQTASVPSTPEASDDEHDGDADPREEILLTPQDKSKVRKGRNGDTGVRVAGEVEVEVVQERAPLHPKDKKWDALRRETKAAMGGLKAIHASETADNDVHHLLRVFDMTAKYGPCVGVTRLQRWERAKKWGLNPPDEIRQILETREGADDVRYRENVLYSWLG